MARIVPDRRLDVSTDTVFRAGRAVRAPTWRDMAALSNWVMGRGQMIVPYHFPAASIAAADTDKYTFAYRVRPRYQALERHWVFAIRSNPFCNVNVYTPATATAVVIPAPTNRNVSVRHAIITETLSSQSLTEQTIEVAIASDGESQLRLDAIGAWEVPRAQLDGTTSDLGSDLNRFRPSQPIVYTGVTANAESVAITEGNTRRGSLYQWAVPFEANASTTTAFAKQITSTSYTDVFSLPIPMLARRLAAADTTAELRCKVLAWVTGGTANVRINSSKNGASSAVTINQTSPTSFSAPITFTIDCEDLSTGNGLQSGTVDYLDIEARKNASGTLYIASVSVWEE